MSGAASVDWADAMSLGGGFDLLRSLVKGSASDVALSSKDTTSQPNEGQNVTAMVQKVETTHEYSNTMEIDADLSIGYGAYSASASAGYLKSKKINKYSLYYSVSCNVIENTKILSNGKFKLSDAAKQLTQEEFKAKFGDYYVAGYKGGGTFTGLMEIVTDSDEERTKIEQGLKAGADVGGVSVELTQKFVNEINEVNKTNTVNAFLFQKGGNAEEVPIKSVDDIVTRAASFPSQVSEYPAPITAVLMPYSSLIDYPWSGSDDDYSIPYVEDQKKRLALAYQTAKYYADCVFYAQQNPSQFNTSAEVLQQLYTDLNNYMSAVFLARQDLDTNPKQPAKIPVMPDVSALPPRILTGPKLAFNPPIANPSQLIQSLSIIKFDNSEFGKASRQTVANFATEVSTSWSKLSGFVDNLVSYLSDADTSAPSDLSDMFADLKTQLDGAGAAVDNSVAITQGDFSTLKKKYPNSDVSHITDALQVWWPGADAAQNSLVCGKEYIKALGSVFDSVHTRITVLPSSQTFSSIISYNPDIWKTLSTVLSTARTNVFTYNSQ